MLRKILKIKAGVTVAIIAGSSLYIYSDEGRMRSAKCIYKLTEIWIDYEIDKYKNKNKSEEK